MGFADPGPMHVDRVLEGGGETGVGSERVLVIEARGHAKDGSAYLLANRGLLLTGDYSRRRLSRGVEFAERRDRDLRAAAGGGAWRAGPMVVPGHGPAMTPEQAMRSGEEDVAYLRALRDAAWRAVQDGTSTAEAWWPHAVARRDRSASAWSRWDCARHGRRAVQECQRPPGRGGRGRLMARGQCLSVTSWVKVVCAYRWA